MTEPTIRRARWDEAEALTRLAMLSKQSNGYDATFMAACAEELRVTPALIDAHAYWVAEDEGLVGLVSLRIDADGEDGEVSAFFIHPEWQGRGIGRRLWAEVEQAARDKGLAALHLEADPAAEPFYRRLGFETVGAVPSGSIPGRALPLMRVALGT